MRSNITIDPGYCGAWRNFNDTGNEQIFKDIYRQFLIFNHSTLHWWYCRPKRVSQFIPQIQGRLRGFDLRSNDNRQSSQFDAGPGNLQLVSLFNFKILILQVPAGTQMNLSSIPFQIHNQLHPLDHTGHRYKTVNTENFCCEGLHRLGIEFPAIGGSNSPTSGLRLNSGQTVPISGSRKLLR